LKAICNGTHRKADGSFHSLDDRRIILSRYLRIDVSGIEIEQKPPAQMKVFNSEIGTRLHAIIERVTGGRIECSECRDEVTKLNLMTAEQVQVEKEAIATGIVNRGKKKAPKFWQRWGAKLAPGIAKQQAVEWIDQACNPVAVNEKPEYPIPFVTEITTGVRIAKRKNPRWQETIRSLVDAGFTKPITFAEPDADIDADVIWPEKLGAAKSFKAMCEHLVNKSSEWVLLCEDDILVSKHTADYIRTMNVKDEVLSLYTAGPRQSGKAGWNKCGSSLVGSLALLMRRSVLQKIMLTKAWAEWPKHDCVDRLIRAATVELGIAIMLPNPSLVQHTGDTPAIYENRKITDIRQAKDWTDEGTYRPPSVTLITPTGDRQESFALCEKWMRQQGYTGDIQWIVVDDGVTPTTPTMGQLYIREKPMRDHSLCRNLRSAIPHVTGDLVFVIEDDDYYCPHYLSTMAGRLSRADLAGEFGAKYYYLRHNKWRHRHTKENHASLCRTGMTRAVLSTLAECATGSHPSVDLRLWSRWKGSKISWRDTDGTQSLCVGIKGVDGRQSNGWRPSKDSKPDYRRSILQRWVGKDSESYQKIRAK
jgi:hypothetical protein